MRRAEGDGARCRSQYRGNSTLKSPGKVRLRPGRHGQQHRVPGRYQRPDVLLHRCVRHRGGRRGDVDDCSAFLRRRHGPDRGCDCRPHAHAVGPVPAVDALVRRAVRRSRGGGVHHAGRRGGGQTGLRLYLLRVADDHLHRGQHSLFGAGRSDDGRKGRARGSAILAFRHGDGGRVSGDRLRLAAGAIARWRRRSEGSATGFSVRRGAPGRCRRGGPSRLLCPDAGTHLSGRGEIAGIACRRRRGSGRHVPQQPVVDCDAGDVHHPGPRRSAGERETVFHQVLHRPRPDGCVRDHGKLHGALHGIDNAGRGWRECSWRTASS